MDYVRNVLERAGCRRGCRPATVAEMGVRTAAVKRRDPFAGSVGVAAWIARIGFWILIAIGIAYGDLSKKGAAAFAVMWLVGYLGIPRVDWWAGSLVLSSIAVLDIALAVKPS